MLARRALPPACCAAPFDKDRIINRKTLRIQALIRRRAGRAPRARAPRVTASPPCARGAPSATPRRRRFDQSRGSAPADRSSGIVRAPRAARVPTRPATRSCAVDASTSSRASPASGASARQQQRVARGAVHRLERLQRHRGGQRERARDRPPQRGEMRARCRARRRCPRPARAGRCPCCRRRAARRAAATSR